MRIPFARFILSIGFTFALATPTQAIVFTVNSTGDGNDVSPLDGVCWTGNFVSSGGPFSVQECTLRAAIQVANDSVGQDTIRFGSPLAPDSAGEIVITPTSPMPDITDPLIVDGTSAPTYDLGNPDAAPVVVLDGSLNTDRGLDLRANAHGSEIHGLSIIHYPIDGILLGGANDVLIQGNYIGLRPNGNAAGNGNGIRNAGPSEGAIIGQTFNPITGFTGAGNVIAANTIGIETTGQNTQIVGNKIGTDPTGTATSSPTGSLGNTVGVVVGGINISVGRAENLAGGGPRVVSGNVVSGNQTAGILLGQTNIGGCTVLGNRIGTDAAGLVPLGNGTGPGILIVDADTEPCQIGEIGPGRNVITSTGVGVNAIQFEDTDQSGPIRNTSIVGNHIGINAPGTATIGTTEAGIRIADSAGIVVEGNLIGGCVTGILDTGASSVYVSNHIGTSPSGDDFRNSNADIQIEGTLTAVGNAGAGNTLGFSNYGIRTRPDSSFALIQGNWIGSDSVGRNLGHSSSAVEITGFGHELGGEDLTHHNVIGNSAGPGVTVGPFADDNFVIGNWIGTDALDRDLGNAGAGLRIVDSNRTRVGLPSSPGDPLTPSHGNHFAFNGAGGTAAITVEDLTGNGVEGNTFYDNSFFSNGGPAIDLDADGPTSNDPGDTDAGANRLQNTAAFPTSSAVYNTSTGTVQVDYLVDSLATESTYPLRVDFYLEGQEATSPGPWIGTTLYLASDATLSRFADFVPASLPQPGQGLFAIVTDDDGNASELSARVPVPEPGFGIAVAMTCLAALAGNAFRRKRRA